MVVTGRCQVCLQVREPAGLLKDWVWAGESHRSKAWSFGRGSEVKSEDGWGKRVEGQVEIQKSVLDMTAWDKSRSEEDTQSSGKKYWPGSDLGGIVR